MIYNTYILLNKYYIFIILYCMSDNTYDNKDLQHNIIFTRIWLNDQVCGVMETSCCLQICRWIGIQRAYRQC